MHFTCLDAAVPLAHQTSLLCFQEQSAVLKSHGSFSLFGLSFNEMLQRKEWKGGKKGQTRQKRKKIKKKAVVPCCNFWWFVVHLLSLCLFCTPDSFFWVCSTPSHSPCNKKGVLMSCYTLSVLPPFGPFSSLCNPLL